jgi:hypothetical protein
MNVKLETLLKAAIEQQGDHAVIEMVQDAMRQKVAPASLDSFLRREGAPRRAYESATNPETEPTTRLRNLATCIRKMGLEFRVDTRHFPWSGLAKGSTVAVVIGIRRVTIKEVSSEMKQRAVGARDMESLVELSNLLIGTFQTGGRVELHLLAPDMTLQDAGTELGKLRQRKEVGAIVVLGSPVTNRLCDPLARTILGSEKPRALFRWSHHRPASLLSEPEACKPEEEGICVLQPDAAFYARMPDDEVLRRYRAGDRGPFPDCGILMIDCRVRPYLILAAGHGGCGTKACVRALSDQEEIEKMLDSSGQSCSLIIRAKREWTDDRDVQTASPTDNLDLPPRKGWFFEWDD